MVYEKTFDIWVNKKIEIPWLGGSNSDIKEIYIAWDESRAYVEKFIVNVSAKASARTNLELLLNGNTYASFHWDIFNGSLKTFTGDIKQYLRNGTNVFGANFSKDWFNPFPVELELTVVGTAVFESKIPGQQPPPPIIGGIPGALSKYILPITIGVLGGAAVAGIMYIVRRRRG